MITKVRLRNWKSHAFTELEFGEGPNILVGPNGAGKSSVLEAITFALFGTTPEIRRRQIRQEKLIRTRENFATVEVSFISPQGDEIYVKREIRREEPSRAELRRNGELIVPEGAEKVTQYIESVLEMDYDFFERAIYSEQNQLDLLLKEKERKKKIDELLGIDKLEEARKKATFLTNFLSKEVAEDEKILQTIDVERIEQQLRALWEEIRLKENQLANSKKRKEEIEAEIQEREEERKRLRRLQEEIRELERKLNESAGAIKSLEERKNVILQKLGPLAEVPLKEMEEEMKRVSEELTSVRAEKTNLEGKLRGLQSQLSRNEGERDLCLRRMRDLDGQLAQRRRDLQKLEELNPEALEEQVGFLRRSREEAREKLTRVTAQLAETREKIERLAEVSAVCPVCETPLDESRKSALLEERRRKVVELEEERRMLDTRLKELDVELREKEKLLQEAQWLAMRIREIEGIERERNDLQRRIEELERENDDIKRRLEELRLEMGEIEKREQELDGKRTLLRDRLRDREELERIKVELGKRQAEDLRLRAQYYEKRKSFDEKRLEELGRRLEELRESLGELEGSIREISRALEQHRKFAEELERRREELRRREVEVKVKKEAVEYLSKVHNALVQTQRVLREEFVVLVNEYMNALWAALYPYGDFRGLELKVVEGDYVLQLRDRQGYWRKVEGEVSGGERTMACLVMRMAFSLALAPKLGWIILDEPTHNLDKTTIDRIAAMMRERLPREVKQVILITHEESLEVATGYLYRLHRNKETGEPTRVELLSSPEFPINYPRSSSSSSE